MKYTDRARLHSKEDRVPPTAVSRTQAPKWRLILVAALVYMAYVYVASPISIFGAAPIQYTITLDRNGIPNLNYDAVTLNLAVGNVNSITLQENGNSSLPYSYNSSSGMLSFTTDGNYVVMTLDGPAAANFNGQVSIAPLKDNKEFAWSHGMDDNVFLEASVAAFDSFNYRGTIYAIGEKISDTRDESWIFDKINLHELLGKGWAIGNHSYSHGCYGVDYNSEITAGYNRLAQLIPDSPWPSYVINSFAAPCFDASYHPYILQHRNNGTTPVIFNESGNDQLLVVNDGASNYSSSGRTAKAFNFDLKIGRGHAIELGDPAEAKAIIDWMANNANSNRNFWYNTYSHDSKEVYLTNVMSYIYNNYGAAGNQAAWVAPAEEIYSYLVIRDSVNISVSNGGGNLPTPTPTPAQPTATPTPVPPTPTPTPESSVQISEPIYDDSLAAPWSAGTWGSATYQASSSAQVYQGSSSMALDFTGGWSTLYIKRDQPLSTDGFEELSLWVFGASNGSSKLRVASMDSSYVTSNRVTFNNLAAGWQNISIELTDLGSPTDIFYILLENPSGSAQPTLYLDEVLLGSSSGGPPPPAPTNTPNAPTATNTPNSPAPTNTPTPVPPTPTNTPTNTPSAPSGSVDGLDIYDDSLIAGWSNGTWGNIVKNLANTSPVQDGNRSIKVDYNEAWGTFYMLSPQGLDASQYASITLWIYGHSSGNSTVAISVMNSAYQTSFRATLSGLASGWQFIRIPMADLGPLTDIRYILIDNPNTSGQQPIFLDEIVLEDINSANAAHSRSSAVRIDRMPATALPIIDGRQVRPMISLSGNLELDNEYLNQPNVEPQLYLPLLVQ